jgi:hypothetical protein
VSSEVFRVFLSAIEEDAVRVTNGNRYHERPECD